MTGIRIINYSWLAYTIRKWRSLAYIRDWHASYSRMAYASQEQALKPPIHEYSRLACTIREWEVIRDWTRTYILEYRGHGYKSITSKGLARPIPTLYRSGKATELRGLIAWRLIAASSVYKSLSKVWNQNNVRQYYKSEVHAVFNYTVQRAI